MSKTKFNPFSPGGIVKSTLFGGRHEYIIDILKRLSSVKGGKPASFYLFGERGIGKTALAKLISFIATTDNQDLYKLKFISSYYTIQKDQGFKSVLEASLNNVADQIEESVLKKIGSRMGKIFKDGKFSIGAFGFQAGYEGGKRTDKLNGTIVIKDQVVSILRNIISQIRTTTPEAQEKDGVLIIMDEMDNLYDVETAASIIRGITAELDFEDRGYISFLLIGYESGYESFVRGDESIRRLLDPIQLKEMPEIEVIETFEKGFNEAKVKWDEEELKKRVWLTGGYPLAIQVMGYHLIEADNNSNITEPDWEASVAKSANELIDKEFSAYYSFGTDQKKNADKILQSLVVTTLQNCESLKLKEIEQISGVINPVQYLKGLMKNGVVSRNKINGEYVIKRGLLRTSILFDLFKDGSDKTAINNYLEMTAIVSKIKESKGK